VNAALTYDPNANPQPIETKVPEAPITQRPSNESPAADAVFGFGEPLLRSKQLHLGSKGRIRVAVGCTGALPCGMRVTLRAGRKTLGSRTRTVQAGGTATIVIKLAEEMVSRAK
jgi:hypothetical protein